MRDRESRDCPSALDLFEYVKSGLSETQTMDIHKHISTCGKCIETLKNLKGYVTQDMNAYQIPDNISEIGKWWVQKGIKVTPQRHPEEIMFGQLWSTKAYDSLGKDDEMIATKIVAILSEECPDNSRDATVVVAPISLESEFQSKYDLRVFEKESPLGYEFMIEVWNQTTTLVSQIDKFLGTLSEKLNNDLKLLNRSYLGQNGNLDSLSDRIGWPIFHDNDPRSLFQIKELEESNYLRKSVFQEFGLMDKTRDVVFKELADIWFKREDGSLFFAEIKEPAGIAMAAPSDISKNWFLCIKSKLNEGDIIGKLSLNLVRDELKLIFEQFPKSFILKEILLIGYNESKVKLFSEALKVELNKRYIIAKDKCILPHDIGEINLKIHASK